MLYQSFKAENHHIEQKNCTSQKLKPRNPALKLIENSSYFSWSLLEEYHYAVLYTDFYRFHISQSRSRKLSCNLDLLRGLGEELEQGGPQTSHSLSIYCPMNSLN